MATKSRFFQAGFSAALAIALLMSASSARAEVVTLVCKNDGPTRGVDSFTLRIDYDRKIVDHLRPDGTAFDSAAARITEGAVNWGDYGIFRGSLNRLSGQGSVAYPLRGVEEASMSGPCRRATQKF